MREIKFRGLSVDGGGWVCGWLVPRSIIEDPDTLDRYWIATGFEDEVVPVVEETVGQFTGLNDKEGVEIWEGDIVYIGKRGHVIEWRDGGMGYFVDHIYGWVSFSSHKFIDKYRQRSCVKGNIHQQEA